MLQKRRLAVMIRSAALIAAIVVVSWQLHIVQTGAAPLDLAPGVSPGMPADWTEETHGPFVVELPSRTVIGQSLPAFARTFVDDAPPEPAPALLVPSDPSPDVPPGMPADWTEETHGPYDPGVHDIWNSLPWCPPFSERLSIGTTPTPIPIPDINATASCKIKPRIVVDLTGRTAFGSSSPVFSGTSADDAP